MSHPKSVPIYVRPNESQETVLSPKLSLSKLTSMLLYSLCAASSIIRIQLNNSPKVTQPALSKAGY